VSALATLETKLWQGDASPLAESHSHRAVREDSLGVIKGRDAIIADWVSRDAAEIVVTADLGDVIGIAAADKSWRLHRWVWREEGRVVCEVEVTDRARQVALPPIHPPLGELRAGQGQYAPDAQPVLPAGFPGRCVPLATLLHRSWNARALGAIADPVQKQLLRDLPDAVILFEAGHSSDRGQAVLFRLMGHHASGRRIRLIGSAIAIGDDVETLIDLNAYAAQIAAGHIDYGLPSGT
jgi:hypothetical protein